MTPVRPAGAPEAERIQVFNFFGGIKSRGIPVYASELEVCLDRLGVVHWQLRAPRWMRSAPAWLQNICFVLYEQVVAPLAARWRGCRLTVYPYNSASLLDAVAGRSVVVIHDLIPNRRDSRGLAAWYVQISQAIHVALGRPVATVSRHTMRQLARIDRFRGCDKYLWANPFYAFENALNAAPHDEPAPRAGKRVLLCSGIGANKDFRGALRLLRSLDPSPPIDVRILGFGDEAHLARRRLDMLGPDWEGRVTVLPRLGLDEAVSEFRHSDLVWVHSRNEGFGRPVMEARMCGRPVLASDIGAFRQLRRFRRVHLYRDDDFGRAFAAAMADACSADDTAASAQHFNRQLEEEVARLLSTMRRPTE